MPIDDWIYWGEDAWWAGVIWKEWNMGATIDCITDVTCITTYTASPTIDIQSDFTLAVEDTFLPQASANITSLTFVGTSAVASYPTAATINSVTTATITPAASYPAAASIGGPSATALAVNDTFTHVVPTAFGGLVVWLDATDNSTVTENNNPSDPAENGDTVTLWIDKTGNGNSLGNINGTPAYNTAGINGHATVDFVASNSERMDFKPSGTTMDPAATTIFVVSSGGGSFATLLRGTVASPTKGSYELNKSAYKVLNTSLTVITATATALTTGQQLYRHNPISINSLIYFSSSLGDQQQSTSLINSPANPLSFTVGGYYDLGGAGISYWTGKIGEILIYNVALTQSQYESIASYLKDKWGL